MFALHQRSRRIVCRVAFLVLCAVPTVLVLGWILYLHTPFPVRAAAHGIGTQLGVEVSLDRVSHPRPGATVYHGVVLTERETGQRILATREVRTARSGGTLLVTAARIELQDAHLDLLWQVLADRLRIWQAGSIQLAVGQVAMGPTTATRLRGRLEATGDRAQSLITFCLPDTAEESPIRVHIVRNRQTTPPATQVELRTGNTSLPCSIAWPLLPGLAQLGDDAHFRGVAWGTLQRGGWTGQILGGELTDVDFDRLVSSHYPCRLSGTARIVIQQARLRDGRLSVAAGSLAVGPGLISRSLCQAALEGLHLFAFEPFVTNSQLIPYEQLACKFAVDSHGLKLQGACRGAPGTILPSGTILTTTTGPLLAVTRSVPLSPVALVRTLVPRRDLLVPATPAAEALVRTLPALTLDGSSYHRDPESTATPDAALRR
jgi:hypothetical protein